MVKCAQCGSCCRFIVIPNNWLRSLPSDYRKWLTLHLDPHPDGLGVPMRCRALELKDGKARCTCEATKPSICREWEPGGPDCTETRALFGLGPLTGD